MNVPRHLTSLLSGLLLLTLALPLAAQAPRIPGAAVALEHAIKSGADLPDVPLYLPADERLREVARVTRGEGWVAAAMNLDDIGVFIQGNSVAVERPGLSMQLADTTRLTRNEGTVHVSFFRSGLAYTLMVECASPFGDRRCTDDDFALSLVEGLVRQESPQ